jgi:Trypsin-like peptidase domain
VGRIVAGEERAARLADETAFAIGEEVLRSAFAISDRHVLTAWHCVRESVASHTGLWFRLRTDGAGSRRYSYIPLRVTNYDAVFDVAALAVDEQRLAEAGLTASAAAELLAHAAIPLGVDPRVNDQAQVIGFPASATGADSDTNSAEIVDTSLPLGDAVGLKLFGPAFAAVSPVDPHGLSGGPVLKTAPPPSDRPFAAVGVVRAVPRGSISRAAAGGCIIATRIEDVAGTLPEVAVALSAAREGRPPARGPASAGGVTVLALLEASDRALRSSVVDMEDPALGRLVGWAHFFDEPPAHRRPTAISTAYGLKLALTLDRPDGRLDRSALAETLWKLRLPDGGWAARTGSGIARPEVSALVLGALAAAGHDPARRAEASAAFEQALAPDSDPVARERTYVVSAAMRGLVLARPRSPRLPELRAVLLAGAIRDPGLGNLLCWPSRLKSDGSQPLTPSVAHTAMAVVALARAGHVLGQDTSARSALEQAVRWLVLHRSLDSQTEQIRRFVSDNHPWESLTVGHFTPAWVARALLAAPVTGEPGAAAKLSAAVGLVWDAQRNGIWESQEHDRPVWMTYQGASVLRAYALRSPVPLTRSQPPG